jgi:hypothetical protein
MPFLYFPYSENFCYFSILRVNTNILEKGFIDSVCQIILYLLWVAVLHIVEYLAACHEMTLVVPVSIHSIVKNEISTNVPRDPCRAKLSIVETFYFSVNSKRRGVQFPLKLMKASRDFYKVVPLIPYLRQPWQKLARPCLINKAG